MLAGTDGFSNSCKNQLQNPGVEVTRCETMLFLMAMLPILA